ncbi:LutB/LldF family L-lactate oxidation iron-sulfur protein [Aquisalimonas lutea]|uniref:LutB/LldF family L-lactate oxidation iron-sulfur protein n=1 Tax=Aquisalimonas lutea TaxID=1327750 RepID=UPI0025B40504|nr:LutB/LldF family L-lactate oxidation iron-sulfur protein [Aquisalimonas lutea]MDN3518647.1 LutB/LldF family L-lactate oxidation iron-sulfur protein [Aquisalimonas lutea]
MESRAQYFKPAAREALHNPDLQQALANVQAGFVGKRKFVVDRFPDFEGLRERGRRIKDHTLANLDVYLEQFEAQVHAAGGHVHWAGTQDEAQKIVTDICRQADARIVTKGKTMAGEEVELNEALEAAGVETVETDLGEYIIQLAHEPPSHIIAPAIHKTRQQISDLFNEHHHRGTLKDKLREVPELVDEARGILRQKFLSADVGITGANCLVAETGSLFLVTNEGNGDLTHSLPRVHVAIAGIEKLVPTLEDAATQLRLLARSATGQDMTAYTTMVTGPRRAPDTDGPEEFHIVLLDNGRTRMLEGRFREMLRCIRCGACMNHCPVYSAIGGHAYGWVYPGPMGSVLTPLIVGLDRTRDLPNACTLNGRCQSVCPVKIPLPDLLRDLREEQYQHNLTPRTTRWGLAVWAWFARRPRLYNALARAGIGAMGRIGRRKGRFRHLPLAGGWTAGRDFPAPQRTTFQAAWRQQRGANR